MLSEPVLVALISAVSGIFIAYIVNVAAKKVQAKRAERQPKDRMEQMFDGYERLIKQKDLEDDRKQKYIHLIEQELTATKEQVQRLEEALDTTNDELDHSRKENQKLKGMLEDMRKEYSLHKHRMERPLS